MSFQWANAQKYKVLADSSKLQVEYIKVSTDIAALKLKINEAEINLPGYQNASSDATVNAQTAATLSSEDAQRASDGNSLHNVRDAKKTADKAYSEAEKSEREDRKLRQKNEELRKLREALGKKEARLKVLDLMRSSLH
jgi:hypothetical protein